MFTKRGVRAICQRWVFAAKGQYDLLCRRRLRGLQRRFTPGSASTRNPSHVFMSTNWTTLILMSCVKSLPANTPRFLIKEGAPELTPPCAIAPDSQMVGLFHPAIHIRIPADKSPPPPAATFPTTQGQRSASHGTRRSLAGAARSGSSGWPAGRPACLVRRASCAAWLGLSPGSNRALSCARPCPGRPGCHHRRGRSQSGKLSRAHCGSGGRPPATAGQPHR